MGSQHPRPSRRVERVASRLRFVISHVIQHGLRDPRIGLITVLRVEPTEDLKEAKVYVSVFGSTGDRSKAEHALNRARGFIQNEVGRNLETRNTPILRFVFDDSQDKVSRMEALIHKAVQEDRESTMAKKPSKKPSKPEREAAKPGKKPAKSGAPLEDEAEGETKDKGEAGDENEYESKANQEEDFDKDFDDAADKEGKGEAKEEAFDEDFDEDYPEGGEDEEEESAQDEEEEDEEEEDDDFDSEDEDEEEEEDEDEDGEDYSYGER